MPTLPVSRTQSWEEVERSLAMEILPLLASHLKVLPVIREILNALFEPARKIGAENHMTRLGELEQRFQSDRVW